MWYNLMEQVHIVTSYEWHLLELCSMQRVQPCMAALVATLFFLCLMRGSDKLRNDIPAPVFLPSLRVNQAVFLGPNPSNLVTLGTLKHVFGHLGPGLEMGQKCSRNSLRSLLTKEEEPNWPGHP